MGAPPPVPGVASVAPSSGRRADACLACHGANEPADYRAGSLLSLQPPVSGKRVLEFNAQLLGQYAAIGTGLTFGLDQDDSAHAAIFWRFAARSNISANTLSACSTHF